MNICNFAKVFIARATKDIESINFWREKDNQNYEWPQEPPTPRYDTTLSSLQRYNNYINYVTESCPKLHMNFDQFRLKLPRVQQYLTTNSYWKKCNKTKDKSLFVNTFSIYSWAKLSMAQRKSHTLYNCNECVIYNPEIASKHASADADTTSFVNVCNDVTNAIMENSPPNKTEKCVQTFVKILNPITQEKLGVDLVKSVSKAMKLTPKKKYEEKRSLKRKTIIESKKNIALQFKSNDLDVDHFLASGKSYNQYDRDRLFMFYEPKEDAEIKMNKRVEKERSGKVKPKKHHGSFENYQFDKDAFLTEIREKETGSSISWRALGKKYDVKNSKGLHPMNAGEVLKEYAKSQGINIDHFNLERRISGRDYLRRIRRAKKTISKNISVPSSKSGKSIRHVIKQRIDTGIINIGRKITPSTVISSNISKTGKTKKKHKIQHCWIFKSCLPSLGRNSSCLV